MSNQTFVKLTPFNQQVPLSHIPEPVYKTSVDWINQRPVEALGGFVLWAFDCILTDLAAHQGGAKGGKKGAQQTPSKSQVTFENPHRWSFHSLVWISDSVVLCSLGGNICRISNGVA